MLNVLTYKHPELFFFKFKQWKIIYTFTSRPVITSDQIHSKNLFIKMFEWLWHFELLLSESTRIWTILLQDLIKIGLCLGWAILVSL